MRITHIDIKNYRQYQSLSFDFPASNDKDLHIIVAINGVGKTNLLNAITWCLYGKEPHLGDENEDIGLPKINLDTIEKARNVGNTSEVVEVKIIAHDGEKRITYYRCLPFRIMPENHIAEIAKEKFTVTLSTSNGDPKIYDDREDTKRLVDMYMPEKIREYFYFDGEQLNNYFIGTRKGKVREAIFSISQVDTVSLINKRLGDVIGDKQKDAASKEPDIKKITDQIDDVKKQISIAETNIGIHEEQIATSKLTIKENSEYLLNEENVSELEIKLQDLMNEKLELETERSDLMEDIYEFVREMKSSLTIYPAARKTLDIITQKEAENALPPNIDRALLLKAIEEGSCSICSEPLSEYGKNSINRLIESFKISTDASHILMGIKNELERIVIDVESYPKEKQSLRDRYKNIDKKMSEVEQMLVEVDKRYNQIQDKDEIKRKHNEREEHQELLSINTQKLGVAKDQYMKAVECLERLDTELEKALTKSKDCLKIKQQIGFAARARNVVREVEEEMMNEVRMKMEERTSHYFMNLIWKKDTFEKVILDEDFHLDLIHKDGYSCVGTCGAAERCLLALSFTLALHEVSGFNSMLFIDTPVARVSDVNRQKFADILCDVSSNKQIIMTFTPDEYSADISSVFDPAAKTKINLGMIGERVTVVK